MYNRSYCVHVLDMYDVFSDAESVDCRVAGSLFSCHDIRTQDCRLSQPQPQKHPGNHGARHEGFLSSLLWSTGRTSPDSVRPLPFTTGACRL